MPVTGWRSRTGWDGLWACRRVKLDCRSPLAQFSVDAKHINMHTIPYAMLSPHVDAAARPLPAKAIHPRGPKGTVPVLSVGGRNYPIYLCNIPPESTNRLTTLPSGATRIAASTSCDPQHPSRCNRISGLLHCCRGEFPTRSEAGGDCPDFCGRTPRKWDCPLWPSASDGGAANWVRERSPASLTAAAPPTCSASSRRAYRPRARRRPGRSC